MKKTTLLAVAVLSVAAGSVAHSQVLFGTNFDGSTTYPYNDGTTYTVNTELAGQGNWAGNDDTTNVEATSGNYSGGLNAVVASTVGTEGATSTFAGTLYGEILSGSSTGNNYPGAPLVYEGHSLTLSSAALTYGYTLNTAFTITPPASTMTTSGYGFSFQNSGTNVISVLFVTDPNHANQDLIEYKNGSTTSAPSSTAAVILNNIYHLALSVNVLTGMASITLTSGSQVLPIFTGINIGTAAATSVNQAAALQFIPRTAQISAL